MPNPELNADVLLNLGFVDVGNWQTNGEVITYQLDGVNASANETLLKATNALYAFVEGDQVRYIGKTARSIRKRFVGYCRPGNRQATNRRCHDKIRHAITGDIEIRIFAFAPITLLRYAEFEINLAAGLEDDLIRQFNPPWNGKDNKQAPISEDAEREQGEEDAVEGPNPAATPDMSPVATFTVVLRDTYYTKGFLNPGVEASKFLGKNGDPIRVILGDSNVTVDSKINRTANRTGAVRIVGGNAQIAQWFQENFEAGSTVQGSVLDQHTIRLLSC